MAEKKPKRKSPIESLVHVNIDSPVKYEKKDIKERKTLEFVTNTIKNGDVAVVRVRKWAGISEVCFVIGNKNGKITICQLKEE